MGDSVTVSVRSLLLAGLVMMGLVTAYLVGASGDVVTAPARDVQTTGRTAPGRELAGLAYQSADMARASLPVRAGKDDLRVRIEVVWAFQ